MTLIRLPETSLKALVADALARLERAFDAMRAAPALAPAASDRQQLTCPSLRVRWTREGRVLDVDVAADDILPELREWATSADRPCLCVACMTRKVRAVAVSVAARRLAADPTTAPALREAWMITFEPARAAAEARA